MRKLLMALTAGTMVIPATLVACTSTAVAPVGASVLASKTTFCAANDKIDRDTANIDSPSGFVAALKAHTHQIDVMKANLPAGAVGRQAKKLLNLAESVVATGNPNVFFEGAGNSGGAIDTFCGVQQNGTPLPAYFKQGAKTAFCKAFLPVFNSVNDAASDTATLSALTAHQTQLNQAASQLSTLPKSIKGQATAAIHTAQSAVAANSATPLSSDTSDNAADVGLYCGENE